MGNIFRNERKVPVSINFFHVEHAKEIKENQADAKRKQFRLFAYCLIQVVYLDLIVKRNRGKSLTRYKSCPFDTFFVLN